MPESSESPESESRESSRSSGSLGLRRVGEVALTEVSELVGCPAEGVTGIRKDGDGWIVTVELLEMERIPETTDVLASYDVHVDTSGDVTEYRRTDRYLRAQVEG